MAKKTLTQLLVSKGIKEDKAIELIEQLGLDADDPDDLKFITVGAMRDANVKSGLVRKYAQKLGLGDPDEARVVSSPPATATPGSDNNLALAIVAQATGVDMEAVNDPIKDIADCLRRLKDATPENRQRLVDYLGSRKLGSSSQPVLVVAFLDGEPVAEVTVEINTSPSFNRAAAQKYVNKGLDNGSVFYEFRWATLAGLWEDKVLTWHSSFDGSVVTLLGSVKTAKDGQGHDFGPILFNRGEQAHERMAFLRYMITNSEISPPADMAAGRTAIGYVSAKRIKATVSTAKRAWDRLGSEGQKPYMDFVRREQDATSTEGHIGRRDGGRSPWQEQRSRPWER